MTTLVTTVFNQIVIMLILMMIGMASYKIKLVDTGTNKKLSDLVLMLVNPILIFMSYQREFDAKLLHGLLISILLAIITHGVAIALSVPFIHRKKQENNHVIERFAVVYSNCGFIGIPLVNGIFHSEGVFYITAYMTVFNLFVWTHGVIIMTGKKDRRTLISAILSPAMLATFVGFLFFLTRIKIPSILYSSLNYIGEMNTPLAMLVAGVTIAQTNIIELVKRVRLYYVAIVKLFIVPLVLVLVYRMFPIPREVILTSILAAACPTAVTINLFCIRFQKDSVYASQLFAVTTILSVISIPVVMMIANILI